MRPQQHAGKHTYRQKARGVGVHPQDDGSVQRQSSGTSNTSSTFRPVQSWRLYLPTCREKYGGSGSGSRGGSSSRRGMGMMVLLPGGAHVRRSSYRLSFRMTRPLMTCRSIARSRQSVSATSR